CWPPCIVPTSERTTASASASGMAPVDCTSPCNQRTVSTSSPTEKLMVAVGSCAGAISVSPFKPTAPKRMLLRRICRASVLMADSETCQHFLEEAFEVLAAHPILELEALNAGLREPFAPVPRLQVAERQPAEHDLVTEEGK